MEVMIRKVVQLFWWMDTTQPAPLDPTVYQVETQSHSYCGQIIFQDDVQMKLRVENHRPVKILKQNIQRISIVRQEISTPSWKPAPSSHPVN